jgi:hypothetical protein
MALTREVAENKFIKIARECIGWRSSWTYFVYFHGKREKVPRRIFLTFTVATLSHPILPAASKTAQNVKDREKLISEG